MEKHDKCNSKCNSKCKCKCKALSVASYYVKLKYSPNKKTKEQTQKKEDNMVQFTIQRKSGNKSLLLLSKIIK